MYVYVYIYIYIYTYAPATTALDSCRLRDRLRLSGFQPATARQGWTTYHYCYYSHYYHPSLFLKMGGVVQDIPPPSCDRCERPITIPIVREGRTGGLHAGLGAQAMESLWTLCAPPS